MLSLVYAADLEVLFISVWFYKYIHTLCMWAVTALASLRNCACSHQPSLPTMRYVPNSQVLDIRESKLKYVPIPYQIISSDSRGTRGRLSVAIMDHHLLTPVSISSKHLNIYFGSSSHAQRIAWYLNHEVWILVELHTHYM